LRSLFCPNLGGAARQSIADASDGLSKTVVLAVNENGKSICGGYLEPAWRVGAWAEDGSKSFLFTLRNHAGVGPTKFPMNGSNSYAAYMSRGNQWRFEWSFGFWEGPYIFRGVNPWSGGLGIYYEDLVGMGQAIFNGGQDFFRLARWELWQVA
jgi:hypothetical protein